MSAALAVAPVEPDADAHRRLPLNIRQSQAWTAELIDFVWDLDAEQVLQPASVVGGATRESRADFRMIQLARRLVHCHGVEKALAILNEEPR